MNTIEVLESKTKIACTNLLIELFHTYSKSLCLFWVTKNLIRNVLNKKIFIFLRYFQLLYEANVKFYKTAL
jgi:hypothetical protein